MNKVERYIIKFQKQWKSSSGKQHLEPMQVTSVYACNTTHAEKMAKRWVGNAVIRSIRTESETAKSALYTVR